MMNNHIKVYLCGPINGCTDDECKTWRDQLIEIFPEAIDPMVRDYRGKETESYREIVDLDKRDIRVCDVVVVNYIKPSVGTSMEMFFAWTLGKPIIIWCNEDISLSPWLRYHSTAIFHNYSDVVNAIKRAA